jgi:hypothetical protein
MSALVREAMSELRVALGQSTLSDDAIIMGRVRNALGFLERECEEHDDAEIDGAGFDDNDYLADNGRYF